MTERDKTIVDDSLETLQINHLKNRFTSELSDGEKQLVAIAKVIAQEAPYILLDEPTAFLDYPNKIKVLELLSRIAREMNKCILLSAHDIDLCLEHYENYLIVNKEQQSLTLLHNPTKEELIASAFS
ncbi:MAG: iron complex transport system ATP-binding protein [Flavobacteriaceae bacterium]